jgi:hypothetical protein
MPHPALKALLIEAYQKGQAAFVPNEPDRFANVFHGARQHAINTMEKIDWEDGPVRPCDDNYVELQAMKERLEHEVARVEQRLVGMKHMPVGSARIQEQAWDEGMLRVLERVLKGCKHPTIIHRDGGYFCEMCNTEMEVRVG